METGGNEEEKKEISKNERNQDGKTLHARQVGRRHQGVGEGHLEGDEGEGRPSEGRSRDPVYSEDQKTSSVFGKAGPQLTPSRQWWTSPLRLEEELVSIRDSAR